MWPCQSPGHVTSPHRALKLRKCSKLYPVLLFNVLTQCYYPHTLRESVSHVCWILFWVFCHFNVWYLSSILTTKIGSNIFILSYCDRLLLFFIIYKISKKCYLPNNSSILDQWSRKYRKKLNLAKVGIFDFHFWALEPIEMWHFNL